MTARRSLGVLNVASRDAWGRSFPWSASVFSLCRTRRPNGSRLFGMDGAPTSTPLLGETVVLMAGWVSALDMSDGREP